MPRVRHYTTELTGWANIVAYDPGGTTGWCVMGLRPIDLIAPKLPLPRLVKHFAFGQIKGDENEQSDQVSELAEQWSDAAIVGERWNERGKGISSSDITIALRINSNISWCLSWSGRQLFYQNPNDAMKRWDDDRLKRAKSLGHPWWVVGQEHARDGIRHAALFAGRCQSQPMLRHRAWPHLFDSKGQLAA